MSVGLLFIGRSYRNFVEESLKLGINRRVPLNSLVGFEWGDTVYCATYLPNPGGVPETELLCTFSIERLSLPDDILYYAVKEEIRRKKLINYEYEPKLTVIRDCGDYTLSELLEINISLPELIHIIKKIADDMMILPRVMVGGTVSAVFNDFRVSGFNFNRTLRKVEMEPVPEDYNKELALLERYRQKGEQPIKQTPICTPLIDFSRR